MIQKLTKKIELKWQMIPAYIYEALSSKEVKKKYYNPFFGPGVYLLILYSKPEKCLYQIGMSTTEIGNRLVDHYDGWHGNKHDYFLPENTIKETKNIYDDNISWDQPSNRTKQQNEEVGKLLTHNTYFLVASLNNETKQSLEQIEAIIQHAFIKHRGLSEEWYDRIGCRYKNLSKISENIEIISICSNNSINSFVSPNIPEKIIMYQGELK